MISAIYLWDTSDPHRRHAGKFEVTTELFRNWKNDSSQSLTLKVKAKRGRLSWGPANCEFQSLLSQLAYMENRQR